VVNALWRGVSMGEYDDTYECVGCGRQHTTQADSTNNQLPPVCGCPQTRVLELAQLTTAHQTLENRVSELCVGRTARIVGTRVHGKTKRARNSVARNYRGQQVQITHAFFDSAANAITIWCKRPGHHEVIACGVCDLEFTA
jgi:hypothetical protein